MASKAAEVKKVVMFNLSGAIGTFLFNRMFEALLTYEVVASQAVAWAVSYLTSILWQFALHSALVYGFPDNILRGLLNTYAAYALSIVLSTGFAKILEWQGVAPTVSFWVSTVATGVINYFTVSSAFGSSSSSSPSSSSSSSSSAAGPSSPTPTPVSSSLSSSSGSDLVERSRAKRSE